MGDQYRDSWDPNTPRGQATGFMGALTDEELAQYEALSQRWGQFGASRTSTAANTRDPSRANTPPNLSRSHSRSSEQSTPRQNTQTEGGGGGGGGFGFCCGSGTATNVEEPTPRRTPTRRKSRRQSLDTRETPAELHYSVDALGDIIKNEQGKAVIDYARSIAWNIFRHDLLTDWPNVPKDRKQYFLQCIKENYPQPEGAPTFDEPRMLKYIGKLLSSRRSDARDAYKEGRSQPTYCADELWHAIKEERDAEPHKFRQQEEARAKQTSANTSHLGSGGKDFIKIEFVSYSVNICSKFYKFI